MSYIRSLRIFKNLLWRDFLVIKKDFWGDVINMVTWPTSLAITFGYVLPAFGMDKNYGSFLLIGSLATSFFYLAVGFAAELVNDFEGLRTIDFHLVLPFPSFHILFLQKVVSFALHAVLLAVPLLPMGKILLGDRLNFQNFCWWKFVLIFVSAGLFFGFFALLLSGYVKNQRTFNSIWRRVYTPMLFLGCFWFSFKMAKQSFPKLYYLSLLNPLTYIAEGIRSSVFGPADYMPFWMSFGLLSAFIVMSGFFAFKKLKQRLDFM